MKINSLKKTKAKASASGKIDPHAALKAAGFLGPNDIVEIVKESKGETTVAIHKGPEPTPFSIGSKPVMEALAKHLTMGVGSCHWYKINTGMRFYVLHTKENSSHPMKGNGIEQEIWEVYVRRKMSIPSGSPILNKNYYFGKGLIK